MSYRTFKRVLGETNLERKCRWWFGISLFILLTLSFTWYGQRTDELVDERIHSLSRWDPLESTCRHASLSIL